MIFIISGPSGVGKSSIAQALFRINNLYIAKSYTTREKRHINESEYNFISVEEFKELISRNELLEYEFIYGNYYGSKKYNDKRNVLYLLDYKGGIKISRLLPTITIAILPPSIDELESRLIKRNDTDNIEVRKANAVSEIKELKLNYMYKIVNSNLENTIDKVYEILYKFSI